MKAHFQNPDFLLDFLDQLLEIFLAFPGQTFLQRLGFPFNVGRPNFIIPFVGERFVFAILLGKGGYLAAQVADCLSD